MVLAPMAGVTNPPFRSLCRDLARDAIRPEAAENDAEPGIYVGEMVSARALCHGDRRTWQEFVAFPPDCGVRSLQLYATDAADCGEAVRRLVDGGHVDHIDLNFGCPMPKITRQGGGAAVPARPTVLAAIIGAAVRGAGTIPVTVKFRLGLDREHLTHLATGRIAAEEGAAAVALHARTADQLYDGAADWDAIAELRAAVTTVPVLGNGDLWEADDVLRMLEHTGVDGVVIGRGCLGRPWLFAEVAARLAGGTTPAPPTLGAVIGILRAHLDDLVAWRGDEVRAVREFRKHMSWYLKGYPLPGGDLRRDLAACDDRAGIDALLADLDPEAQVDPNVLRLPRGKGPGRRVRLVLPEGHVDTAERRSDLAPVGG
ncbi:MAG: tRNA dihydrouridine synthase DusB [Actinobacteria bacterium]|nr:tRNA dihydrouridine synthase DusB [Actinomycetota bacterium]